ncbi:TraB family protein [compost metagenome]
MDRTLLGKRNPEMAASIENIMKADQTAFVGVGLLHLLGAQGVPELLRQRGYQVEQIY